MKMFNIKLFLVCFLASEVPPLGNADGAESILDFAGSV